MGIINNRFEIDQGINLNLVNNDKFKTNYLSMYILRDLVEEETSKNALISMILKRGSMEYKTSLEIQRALEEAYGASISTSVGKRGERQVIRVSMDLVDERYVNDQEYIKKSIEIFRSIVFNPLKSESGFNEDYFKQEKENLRKRILARKNNKRAYAIDRCLEEMCKSEKYSNYHLGSLEGLEEITNRELYDHYISILKTSPIEIFYTGNFQEKTVNQLKTLKPPIKRGDIISLKREEIDNNSMNKNMIEESMEVSQGRLVLGYRSGIAFEEDLFTALVVGNEIFGAGVNSKLFKVVREKESLAYDISSFILLYKSFIVIDAGIDSGNKDLTIDLIKAQLDEVKQGNFTDEDILRAKKSLISSYKSIGDSNYSIVEYLFGNILTADKRTIEEKIQDISKVTREDIVSAGANINLDTIYFMKSVKEGGQD